MKIRNVHTRRIGTSMEAAGRLLDDLSGPDDRLWPHDRWPPMQFDRPLGVGAKGGHGPVRYEVVEYVPGRMVGFRFDATQGITRGFTGGHRFELTDENGHVILRHIIEADCTLPALLRWVALVRPLHDALLEDALDRAEVAMGAAAKQPARWSAHVRLLRWIARRASVKSTKSDG